MLCSGRPVIGAFLGIAAQFVLAIGVISYVLPWMVSNCWTPLALSRRRPRLETGKGDPLQWGLLRGT
jgi:hypothetical protein